MTDHFKTIRDALEYYVADSDDKIHYEYDKALTALSQLQKEREELVEGLETIKRKAFYHMVRHADQKGDREVLGEIKEMSIALLSTHKQEAKV